MAVGSSQSGDGTKSVVKIMANIFISFIGSGVLGLPYAFKEVSHQLTKPTQKRYKYRTTAPTLDWLSV